MHVGAVWQLMGWGSWVEIWGEQSDISALLMPVGARHSLSCSCVLPGESALSVYTRAHFGHSKGGQTVNEIIPPAQQMPESEALADMLMENRDFLFTQFAIWTRKAMSKERAATESLEAVSLAPSMPAPKGFDCFLARCTE